MDDDGQRSVLAAAIAREGTSLAWLSQRLLKRNVAYLQQYLTRGTPRRLAEADRRLLAKFLRLSDSELGGPSAVDDRSVAIARYAIAASAGAGALIDGDPRPIPYRFDGRFLARLGVRRDTASLIEVTGDSMIPTLIDGDTILIDHERRSVGARGGVYALRVDGVLSVKRLRSMGRDIEVTSDNPTYPTMRRDAASVNVIGRVVWIGRSLIGL